jgi:von Hippel-Lindau disease tumor supressor
MICDRRGVMLLLTMLVISLPSTVLAQTKHVAEERGIRSTKGNVDIKTSINFLNKGQQPIRVYWLNYKGKRVLYKELNSGENIEIQTFLTHPWLITDGNDNAKDIFFPDSKPRTIEIP